MTRDYRLDNARILLNILVVFGHFFGPWAGALSQSALSDAAYLTHLVFTMPCLAFISGVFSRDEITKDNYYQLIERFLIPYAIFNSILYILIVKFVPLSKNEFFFFDPNIQLWYLLSLVTWRILLPIYTKMRFALFIAVIFSIGIGYVDTLGAESASIYDPVDIKKDTLSIMRSVVLFPYFFLGYYSKNFISNIKQRFFIPAVYFVALFIFCYCLNDKQYYILTQLVYGSYAYKYCALEGIIAIFYRLFVIFLGLAGIFSFICMLPRSNNFLSDHGKNSMYSYILHIFPVMLLTYFGFEKVLNITSSVILILVYLLLAVLVSFILTSKYSVRLFKPFVEPSGKWILKK